MHCPFYAAPKESLKVIDSRTCEGGASIRRRRECLKCQKRFTTYERIEQPIRITVVKKDGRRVPWDRTRILGGLQRACYKRPVPEGNLERLAEEIEEEVFSSFDREATTTDIGQIVIDRLRRLDQVAYVRFASVYRQFRTLDDLMAEVRAVVESRRQDDPSQGRLFAESDNDTRVAGGSGSAPASVAESGNDHPAAPVRKRGRPRKNADGATAAQPIPANG
jgi:transcriptional repressor NrdR